MSSIPYTALSIFSVTGVATRQPRAQFWFDAGKQHWGPVLDVSMGLPHPRQQDCAFKIHVDWDIKEHTDPNRPCTCRCVVGSQLRSESQMRRPGDVGYFSHRGTLRAYQGIQAMQEVSLLGWTSQVIASGDPKYTCKYINLYTSLGRFVYRWHFSIRSIYSW